MNQQSRIVVPAAAPRVGGFSTAEFLGMVEAGAFADIKVELVEGELHRMTPPMNEHGMRQASVIVRLCGLVPEALLRVETGIDCGGDTVLAADVVVLHAEAEGRRLLLPAEIALVVEIAETTLARDLGVKRAKYAAAGIAEYWVIDGARAVTHVYREPVAGDYAFVATTRFGEPLAVPGTGAAIVLG